MQDITQKFTEDMEQILGDNLNQVTALCDEKVELYDQVTALCVEKAELCEEIHALTKERLVLHERLMQKNERLLQALEENASLRASFEARRTRKTTKKRLRK